MKKGYTSVYAKCPFYERERRAAVDCGAGLSPDQPTYTVRFADDERARRYKRRYCRSTAGCTECPVHQMLSFECASAECAAT